MNFSRTYTILAFIILGIISRFMPHPPNFTAIDAIAILGISSLGSIWLTSLLVFSILFFSDLILGFHDGVHFVYLSYGIIALMGHWFSTKKSMQRSLILLVASALIFFAITNFNCWLSSQHLYARTLQGLGHCYFAALPFLTNQIIGNVFYSVLIFGGILYPIQFLNRHKIKT